MQDAWTHVSSFYVVHMPECCQSFDGAQHPIVQYAVLEFSHKCSSNSMELISTMSVTVLYAYARRPKSPITHSASMYPCSL